MSDSERRYDEGEVREIFARAIEEGASAAEGSGLSLTELKAIGVEAGIPPESVERAARSLTRPAVEERRILGGAPLTVSGERRIRTPMDAVPAGTALSVVRSAMGTTGSMSESSGIVEWRASGDAGTRVVTVSSDGDETLVHGMADFKQMLTVCFLPGSILGGVVTMGAFMSAANAGNTAGMMLALLILPTLLVLMRLIYGRLAERQADRLQEALDDVVALYADASAPSSDDP